MPKIQQNSRVYLLHRLKNNEISVWSNLKKLHTYLSEQAEELVGYAGLYKKIRAKNQFKFIMEDEVWVIWVKEVN